MTPSNAIFRSVYAMATTHGDTYDYLPEANAKYPFIFIGEAFNTDNSNSDLFGTIAQTIHVYGTRTHRNKLDGVAMGLHDNAVRMRQAINYNVRLTNYSDRVLMDTTTGTPLLHYVLELEFNYTKRG